MALSRLENFLKNSLGNTLYVDPTEIDSTDAITNQGNSQTKPFKTIQRALIEAARFSFVEGKNNDRYNRVVVIVSPGTHYVDNRPGYIAYDDVSSVLYKNRFGATGLVLSPYNLNTNFDITTVDNELYKLNSVYGGVIIPRGVSLVGKDVKKTKIIPKYVPDPTDSEIESSAIFRLTGGSYVSYLTILDADFAGSAFKNYEPLLFAPKYSHHKLTAFEYVDGVNPIRIKDSYNNFYSTFSDLDNYYIKVSDVYDSGSARPVEPDFPAGNIELQKRVEEYRIISTSTDVVGISSIRSGNGITGTTIITIETDDALADLSIDSPITVAGVSTSVYNGTFVVTGITSATKFTYSVPSIPNILVPAVTNASVILEIDSIELNRAEIHNVNKRSVYGMNGAHFDGQKIAGFKSAVVANFLGASLQKDDNAFVTFNSASGAYEGSESVSNLHTDSNAIYKPSHQSFHIKASNGSIVDVESTHAICHKNQFVSETGSEINLTSSKSSYGENAFSADGFSKTSLSVDDVGYITHIITPQETNFENLKIDYLPLDVSKTISIGNSTRLYLFEQKNADKLPQYAIEGFLFGANDSEKINVILNINNTETDVASRVVLPSSAGVTTFSSKKISIINQSVAGINSIASNTLTFNKNHFFIEGESVRLTSDTGELPVQIESNQVYYTITSGLGSNSIKLARTINDALSGNSIEVGNSEGEIKVVSSVSDKIPGEIGHPIQFDYQNKQWYANVSNLAVDNQIYSTFVSFGTTALGQNTPKTYFERDFNTRNIEDSLYKLRYVIPAGISSARPPIDGFVLQETNNTSTSLDAEINTSTLTNIDTQKNFRFITDAIWSSNSATILTEKPHNLTVGSVVQIENLASTGNTIGIGDSGFNGTHSIIGVSSERAFTYSLLDDPGTKTTDSNVRLASNLPYFSREQYAKNFYIYKLREYKKHISGEQDGVYHLVCLDSSIVPQISPFDTLKLSQPIENLFRELDNDNHSSDPPAAESFAKKDQIGKVVINDPKKSLTKKVIQNFLIENGVGIAITSIETDSNLGVAHTVFLGQQHNLNQIISVGILTGGVSYGSGSVETFYGSKLVGIGTTTGDGVIANVVVSAAGTVTDVTITHGGSGYQIGQSLNVGIGSNLTGIVTVTSILSGVGEVIQISGIRSDFYQQYNDSFRVISVPNSKSISFISTSTIAATGVAGTSTVVGTALTSSLLTVIGRSIGITTISYDRVSGIATVGTGLTAHGLLTNQKIKIVGTATTIFNQEFLIREIVGLTTFTVQPGVSTHSAPLITHSEYVFRGGYSSNNGSIYSSNENVGSRMLPFYVGITTTISAGISSSSTAISITNATDGGLRLGDYIVIDEELMRISSSSIDTVFRGALGTISKNHSEGAIVRKVKVIPVELRNPSHVTASDHTFLNVGFGHGNYSVSLPNRQTSSLSKDERRLGQAIKKSGGQIHYTGVNDAGEYFIGDRRYGPNYSSDEIFDGPIPTVAGVDNLPANIHHSNEVRVDNSIIVNGGKNNTVVSRFDGPVLFTNKLTSFSPEGIEVPSLNIHGDAKISKKITVGISTPITAGGSGDITFNSNPSERSYLGWVFTQQNAWRRFGLVSKETDLMVVSLNRIGIGTTNPSDALNVIGNVSVIGVSTFAGITTVTGETLFAKQLNVVGVSTFAGITTVTGQTLFAKQLNVVGVSTFAGITTVTGQTLFAKQLNVAGILTATTLIGTQVGIGTTGVRIVDDGFDVSSATLDVLGDVRVGSGNSEGLILTSPNGNLFRLTVDNAGAVSAISTSILS